MPELPLTTGNYGRSRSDLPQTKLVNAYIEVSPGGPQQTIRTTRPGLTRQYTVGQGPILAIYQNPGVFLGDVFTVSGSELYRNTTLLGTISYSTCPQFAYANGYLCLVSGGALYVYDGTTLTTQTLYDDGVSPLPPFSGISVLYNVFILPLTGTNKFLYTSVGNPTSINALDLSVAEVFPDLIVQTYVLAEELYIFKNDTTEIWDYTGELNSPFQEAPGRTYQRGCANQASVQRLDNGLFWIADNFSVYRSGATPDKVSTPFIDVKLRDLGDTISEVTALTCNIEGHMFYVLNIPSLGESYAYDTQTGEWARWGTQLPAKFEPGIFLGSCAAGQGNYIYTGSAVDGRVFKFDPNVHTDDGTDIQVVVSGAVWTMGGVQRCNNISLHCVRGVGDALAIDPIVRVRWSDDGGRTWTTFKNAFLGRKGAYYYKAIWRGLGLIQQPGRLFEFYISDPVNVTIEGASINEMRP